MIQFSLNLATDYQGPPYIPNSFIMFDHVYLSPIDEEIVSHFCSIVNSPTVDVNEEGRLFDILSIDVGSHIFLQRSQLFRVIYFTLTLVYYERLRFRK